IGLSREVTQRPALPRLRAVPRVFPRRQRARRRRVASNGMDGTDREIAHAAAAGAGGALCAAQRARRRTRRAHRRTALGSGRRALSCNALSHSGIKVPSHDVVDFYPAGESIMLTAVREEVLPEVVMPHCPIRKVLKGQKALVTGANSGIGKGIALAL